MSSTLNQDLDSSYDVMIDIQHDQLLNSLYLYSLVSLKFQGGITEKGACGNLLWKLGAYSRGWVI